ncbi:MAG: hypothetical protein EXR71_13650 [Myxococcales bacterium]|nr:hypothetical protein [Myxococcales bacterium]
MLAARVALPLLDRLRRSPYGGSWLDGAALGLDVGSERLFFTTARVMPYAEEALDAWIRCEVTDLDRMLAGAAPKSRVGYALGDRDEPARLKQARAVLALAGLGWCGPWPDPAADVELVALTRRACLDVAIGPGDRVGPLFPSAAPASLTTVSVRFTDGARPRWCTLGLSDTVGAPEFWTDLDARLLRIATLHWLEEGSLPRTLQTDQGLLRFEVAPLPLPHALTSLVRVRA